ncbi:hypothetical protein RD792_006630, partial [Penstemon davidsonii]
MIVGNISHGVILAAVDGGATPKGRRKNAPPLEKSSTVNVHCNYLMGNVSHDHRNGGDVRPPFWSRPDLRQVKCRLRSGRDQKPERRRHFAVAVRTLVGLGVHRDDEGGGGGGDIKGISHEKFVVRIHMQEVREIAATDEVKGKHFFLETYIKGHALKLDNTGRRLLTLTAVHLVDANLCSDPGKYVSALLLSLSTMLHLELPHVNVLSKIDLIESYGKLAFNLDFYTDAQDLTYLQHHLNQDPRSAKY